MNIRRIRVSGIRFRTLTLAICASGLALGARGAFAGEPSAIFPQNNPTYAAGDEPVSVAIDDLNGDGDPDLATANFNSDDVSLLLNQNQIASAPDLSVTNIDAPCPPVSGQLPVSYTVTNTGDDDATGPWTDRIYLSDDDTVGDADDILIATFERTNALVSGDNYTAMVEATVDESLTGMYRVAVVTDADGDVDEGASGEDNNALADDNVFDISGDGQVNLQCWMEFDYAGTGSAGNWDVAPDGLSVTQTINGEPTFFISNFDLIGSQFRGQFQVLPGAGDDDFIGLAFGFQGLESVDNGGGYYLFSWKRRNQSFQGFGEAGFKLMKIIGDNPNLWDGEPQAGQIEMLSRQDGNNEDGWDFGVPYDFLLTYQADGNIRVVVRNANTQEELFNTGLVNDPNVLGPGRVGFYNYSQSQVNYAGFTSAGLQPPVADAGGPYSLSESMQDVTVDGSDSDDPDSGGISAYQWDLGADGIGTGGDDDASRTNEMETISLAQAVAKGLNTTNTVDLALEVTDLDGLTDEDTTTIAYTNTAPTADAGGPYSTLTPGESVTLAGIADDADLVIEGLGESLSVEWDVEQADSAGEVGDGFATTADATVSYETILNAMGTRGADPTGVTIYLNVADADGAIASDSVFISLSVADLVADADPLTTTSGLADVDTFTFDWTVTNSGGIDAEGGWSDRVYASSDPTFDEVDTLLGTFPAPVSTLAPGEMYSSSQELTFPSDAGTYYIIVVPDGLNDVPELQNEGDFAATNNTLESIRGANLRVTSTLAPLTAAPGATADFRFTIRNTGNAPASGPFTNTVVASTDQTQGNADDATALAMTFNGTINPGESVQFVEPGTVPMEPGPYFAIACADTEDDIGELNEEDNCRATVDTFTVGAADLIIASDTAPSAGTINEDFTVQWTVENSDASATAIAPWTDRVFLSDDNMLDAGDTLIGESARSANLAPGETYTASAASTWPVTAGEYYIIINADDDDDLEELDNELNNTRVAGTIDVSDPPLPDLEVTALAGPSTATGGESVTIEYTVTNTGTHPASSNWQDAIYLSDDDALDADDTTVRLDPLNEAPLASGESYSFSRTVTLPVSFDATTAYVIVETDASAAVEERFENNNVAVTMPIEVTPTPAPDLVTANVDGPSDATFGQDVTVSWQVTNDGTETAAAAWSDLVFLSTDATLESGDRLLGSVPRDTDVEPGESYTASGVFEMPLDTQTQAGTYFFIVAADGFLGLTETDEDNNASASMPVNVDLPPLPNLRVEAVMSPSNAEVGEPITVAYRLANDGAAEASGSWLNEMRLIAQSGAEEASRGAGSVVAVDSFSGSIPAGGTSDVLEATFNLPDLDADTVIASVETDVDGQVIETDETDNASQAALPTTYLRPDLIPVSINPPATALADETVQLTIGVDNTGTGRARPFWVDGVLLSFDDQPGNDILLGIDSQTTQVLAGESYAQVINVTIPGDLQGDYWFVAQIDRTQRVRELDETNNRLVASSPTMIGQPPRPDLQVTSVATPSNALSSSAVDVSWTVANNGDAEAQGFWVDRVYLSSDPTLSDDDLLIEDFASANPLMTGESYTSTESIVVPSAPSSYYVIVETDANETLNEGLEDGELNNTGASAGTFSVGTFTATANADIDSAPAGTPAQITGIATVEGTSDPAPFVTLDIRVIRSGFLRRFTTMTDANGQYAVTFEPGPTEGGLYEVSAGPSHETGIPATDSFSLWSITAGPSEAFVSATPNIEKEGSFQLRNQGNQPITGLTPTVTGVPEDVDIQFDFDTSRGLALGPNETTTIGYTILATEELSPFLVDVDFTADQPAVANFDLNIRVLPAQPSLTLLPTGLSNGTLSESLIRGERTYAEFSFRNDGGAPTGTLQVQLPEIDWISLSTSATIPPIQPGQTRTVVLQLDPPMDQPFGELTGGVVVTDGSVGIAAPFRFTIISDEVGALEITATDEFTYYDEANGFPNVAGATVEVVEPDTNNLIASGLTEADGRIRFDGLTAGFYNVRVSEPEHGNFQTNILVEAADLTELEAFMPRQVVNYTWSVIPIDFEDEYTISIEAEFETNVPAPVVTIEPASLDLEDVPLPTQVDFTITNHGLITADDVRFEIGDSDVYDAIPLVEDIGDLAGMSSVTVPVIITAAPGRGSGCGSITVFECHDLECGDTTYTYCVPAILFDNGCPPPAGTSPSDGGGGFTGGGGSPFDGGPPFSWQPTQSQPIACDPCVPKCAGSGLGCIPGAGCPVGLGTCAGTFDASSAGNAVASTAGCVGAGINCVVELTPLAGQLSCLCSVLRDCVACQTNGPGSIAANIPCSPGDLVSGLGSIVGGAIGRDDMGQLVVEIPETGNPEADYFSYYYYAYLSSSFPLVEIFGDIDWIEPIDNDNYDAFMTFVTAWQATTDTSSPQGERTTASERDSLAMSLPPYADEMMLDAFIERWNRSLDYYNQGIMTEADLPAGFNPDFIDFELIRALVEFAAEAEDRAIDEQFESVNDALQYAEQTLVLDVTDGGDGVCATVRIQLDQHLTVTRTAFQATLELENATAAPLESVGVDIRITDEFGNEATDRFGIFPPELSGALTAVDGTGSLPGNGIGESNWVILPTNEAAPLETTEYFVSGSFSYDQGGSIVTVPLAPASITVMPDPSLQLKYYLETVVFADDPFTPQLEPSIPFNLGLLVKNNGAGVASDLTITSSQPEIVENDRGLLIDFDIIGTEVGNEEISPSLTVNLGDIGPEETNVARWLMISTLQGEFVSYSASYEHITGLGDPRLSVIESVDIFGLNHVVRNTTSSGDNLPDFLTNDFPDPQDLPDRVHLSENGVVEEVNAEIDPFFTSDLSELSATINATLTSGWNYVRIDDPFDGSFRLASVERSDGSSLLMPENAWQTSRIDRNSAGSPVERFIHIFDNTSIAPTDGEYTLTFDPDNDPPQALAIQSVIEHDGIGEVGLTLAQGEPASEPRGSGIKAIIYTFNEPIDEATFNEATVLVDGTNVNTGDPVELSSVAETVTLTAGDTVGEVRFDPPLPFPARYCVQLAGVADRAGNVIAGDAVRLDLAALPGDATGDRRVNNTDVGGIASLLGTDPIDPMSLFEVRSDLNTDGKIDMEDLTIALAERGADARFTENPCFTSDETPIVSPNIILADIPHGISPNLRSGNNTSEAQGADADTNKDDASEDSDTNDTNEDGPALTFNINGRDHVYRIDTDAIALFDSESAPGVGEMLADFGIDPETVTRLPREGWWTAQLPASLAEGAKRNSFEKLLARSGLYISPVLVAEDGTSRAAVTGELLVRFREDIPADWARMVIETHAGAEAVITPDAFGRTGLFRIDTGATTGQQALDLANRFAERDDVDIAEADMLAFASPTLAHKGEVIEFPSEAPADIAVLAASNTSADAIASHARSLVAADTTVAPFRAFDTSEMLVSATSADILRALTRAEAASPRVTYTDEAFAFPSNLIADLYQSMADRGVTHIAPKGGFPATLPCVTTGATTDAGDAPQRLAAATLALRTSEPKDARATRTTTADLDGNGTVDVNDLAIFMSRDAEPDVLDLNGDGRINEDDLAILLSKQQATTGDKPADASPVSLKR